MTRGLRVGIRERVVRSLCRTSLIQRNRINLARLLCNHQRAMRKEFTVDYYGLKYQGVISNATDWCVYFYDQIIEAEMALLRHVGSLVRRQEKPFVCYDIGANSGHMTLAMASLADQVLTVEPFPRAFSDLRARIRTNRLSHVKAFKVGLSESRHQAVFSMISMINLIAKRTDNRDDATALGTFDTLMVRGDELVQQNRINPPSFIRLNVGDDSLPVLKGFSECLRQASPVLMINLPMIPSSTPLSEEALRSVLYDDAHLFSFRRTHDDMSFSLDSFDASASCIVCIPSDLKRMAEQEWSKLHSVRLCCF